jgi:catechol 2,3-dioxygenase-like lactoylglutathione lyase family enzyme
MQPRIGTISIGVTDLDRSIAFYRDGLGFPTEGIVGQKYENGTIAFIDLEGGMRLALWPLTALQADIGVATGGNPSITLGYMVSSRIEVETVMEIARRAGAHIVKEPVATPWGGYSGYFADPDGHLWEIVWIPEEYGWVNGRYVGATNPHGPGLEQ